MIIQKTVDAPAGYIYQTIIDSVIYDIKRTTGKTVTAAQLNHYEYAKKMGRGNYGRVKITQLEKNRAYAFTTTAGRATYSVSYQLQETEDNQTAITYEETSDQGGTMAQLNQSLMTFLMGRGRKKRVRAMFDQMAKQYHEDAE